MRSHKPPGRRCRYYTRRQGHYKRRKDCQSNSKREKGSAKAAKAAKAANTAAKTEKVAASSAKTASKGDKAAAKNSYPPKAANENNYHPKAANENNFTPNAPNHFHEKPRELENAPYHTRQGINVKSRAPTNGQAALENSVPIDPANTTRRVGVDPKNKEIVVFDRTREASGKEIYHGHVREWDSIKNQEVKNALIKNGNIYWENIPHLADPFRKL